MSNRAVEVVLATGSLDPSPWADLVARSPRLRLGDAPGADAVVLVHGLAHEASRTLAGLRGRAVVVPPLLDAVSAADAHLAHVLVGLAADTWLARTAGRDLDIHVGDAGLECGDHPHALLWHGVALAALASPDLTLVDVEPAIGRVHLRGGGRAITVDIDASDARVIMTAGAERYEYHPGRELVTTPAASRARAAASFRERALAAALHDDAAPSLLGRAAAVMAEIRGHAPHLVNASPASVAAAGDGAPGSGAPVIDLGPEPTELWPFLAGVKPLVFLTVPPDTVDTTLAHFGDAHVERRERRVRVEDQDRWIDDRISGDAHIELYIAREPALARRAVALQTGDPSAAAVELGRLMGYPECCIRAFTRQANRSNNSLNRYLAAARSPAGPWPWELNDLRAKLVPFYPCRYTCGAARAFAAAGLRERDKAYAGSTERLHAALATTVWYLDDAHQVWGYFGPADPERGFVAAFE